MRSQCILIAALTTFAPAIATAQGGQLCAARADIVAQLEKKYGETRRAAGLQNRGSVTEIFASEKTGTWTIIVTRPDGVACAVAAGEAWQQETAELVGSPV